MTEELEISSPERRKLVFNKKIIKKLKLIFYVLCVCALIYQVTTLSIQYLQYKTVVRVMFEKIKYNRLPAVTICYPKYLSMAKVAQKYPQLAPDLEEYKNILANASQDDYYSGTLQRKLNWNVYREKFENFISKQNLSIAEYYDLMFDYKLPSRLTFSGSALFPRLVYNAIEVTFYGIRRYPNGSIARFDVSDTNPIQTKFGDLYVMTKNNSNFLFKFA